MDGLAPAWSSNSTSEPPHSGSWKAWLDGYGTTHTDTLSQSVTIPAGCTATSFSFWLHIDTAETTTTTAYDTLTVTGRLGTVDPGHVLQPQPQHRLRPAHLQPGRATPGRPITLKFTGSEDASLQTSFVLDDTAINTG